LSAKGTLFGTKPGDLVLRPILLALALLPVAPATGEPVLVPGRPDAIRRLLDLGGHPPAREFFLDVNRSLLVESSPHDPWEANPRRQAVALRFSRTER
jgi:hypothetical protein